jgi:hypothetical protein
MLPKYRFYLLALILLAQSGFARDVSVSGYTRKDGTYVAPHYRSAPDGDFSNNWTTLGNMNPHTGEIGTLTSPSQPSRQAEHTSEPSAAHQLDEDDEELDAFYPYDEESAGM